MSLFVSVCLSLSLCLSLFIYLSMHLSVSLCQSNYISLRLAYSQSYGLVLGRSLIWSLGPAKNKVHHSLYHHKEGLFTPTFVLSLHKRGGGGGFNYHSRVLEFYIFRPGEISKWAKIFFFNSRTMTVIAIELKKKLRTYRVIFHYFCVFYFSFYNHKRLQLLKDSEINHLICGYLKLDAQTSM